MMEISVIDFFKLRIIKYNKNLTFYYQFKLIYYITNNIK